MKNIKKASKGYQTEFRKTHPPQIYDECVKTTISSSVKLHEHFESPQSSAAACLNVLGYLNLYPNEIPVFFQRLGLDIEEVIPFPTGVDVRGKIYDDKGPIVFEWIGPKKSPINESGEDRGKIRTSIDAFFLAKISGKITQILVEWKFTETPTEICLFAGSRGTERLWRYSEVLKRHRRCKQFPFRFEELHNLGLSDFSYEPYYQLLRITLLAKETTPLSLGDITVEDYRVVHLVHSENQELRIVRRKHLQYCPGLLNMLNDEESKDLHELWRNMLSEEESKRFVGGHWDKAISVLQKNAVYAKYLRDRYSS